MFQPIAYKATRAAHESDTNDTDQPIIAAILSNPINRLISAVSVCISLLCLRFSKRLVSSPRTYQLQEFSIHTSWNPPRQYHLQLLEDEKQEPTQTLSMSTRFLLGRGADIVAFAATFAASARSVWTLGSNLTGLGCRVHPSLAIHAKRAHM